MQNYGLAHQGVVGTQEVVDFFHGRLARDEVVHIATERLSQFAADERFAPAGLRSILLVVMCLLLFVVTGWGVYG